MIVKLITILITILITLIITTNNNTAAKAKSSCVAHRSGQSPPTPSSHHNILPHKSFSNGWVAQKPFVDR